MKHIVKSLVLVCLFACFMVGCLSKFVSLNKSIEMVKPIKTTDLAYSDDLVSIKIDLKGDRIGLKITNSSDTGLEIDWNRVYYVDSYGTLKAVLHKGIKFLNKDERQQPSYIPVGTTLDDTIMPTENIFWDTYYLRWDVRPIVPTYVQEEKVDEIIDSFKNGTVSIILPIKVRDEIKEYRFDFKVELTKILD